VGGGGGYFLLPHVARFVASVGAPSYIAFSVSEIPCFDFVVRKNTDRNEIIPSSFHINFVLSEFLLGCVHSVS
jgi:hypothetical protein